MALPEMIEVKYTEEEADYLSVRPVVRQRFRRDQLVELILSVTGKDLVRIQHILRAGTLVFRYYRYWWEGMEAGENDLAEVLAPFPDSDPGRKFRAEDCTAILLVGGHHPAQTPLELTREVCTRKRLFSAQTYWSCLMELAASESPVYQEYSYARRADLFQLALSAEQTDSLRRDTERLATRDVRTKLTHSHLLKLFPHPLPPAIRLLYLCPRTS